MLVLGVDPGSIYTGYGIIEKLDQVGRGHGHGTSSGLRHVTSGRIHAGKQRDLGERLDIIYGCLSEIIETWSPDQAAMEAIFTAKNARSALVLGHARGVAMLTLRQGELPLSEYPPASVKQAITGHGRASKDQVQYMVRLMLELQGSLTEDASDALAVAICHAQSLDFQDRLLGL